MFNLLIKIFFKKKSCIDGLIQHTKKNKEKTYMLKIFTRFKLYNYIYIYFLIFNLTDVICIYNTPS